MFEQAVKVPFLARCPGLIRQPGRVVSELVSAVDLFPTFCELIGTEKPENLPGTSFLPLFAGGPSRRSEVVVFDEYGPVRMIRSGRWKYVHRYPDGPHELYDLTSDPGETQNLYGEAEHESTVLALRVQLEDYFTKNANDIFDARSEGVTGSGQFCRPGRLANRVKVYGERPKTRKEL